MRTTRRYGKRERAAIGVAIALAVGACSGASATEPLDAGGPADADTLEDGGSSTLDASNVVDAPRGRDATVNPGDSSDAGGVTSACSADGGLPVAGDYVASDGTQYWLRQSPTAATFTVVPGGAQSNAAPPHLARIRDVCPHWLVAAVTDGTFARLDWASADGGMLLCQRRAPSLAAAGALPSVNPNDVNSGCGGAAWVALTAVSP